VLTNEYYQLRDFLMEKAVQAGVTKNRGGWNGCNSLSGIACGLSGPGTSVKKTN